MKEHFSNKFILGGLHFCDTKPHKERTKRKKEKKTTDWYSSWTKRQNSQSISQLNLSDSLTPNGYPTIQSFLTLLFQVVSVRHYRFKGSVPQECPHFTCQFQVPDVQAAWTSVWLGYKFEFPQHPHLSGLIIR